MWQREVVTERLADIIQVLQLARKTGVLTAERMDVGGAGVHGTIKLLRGQIIHSVCGEYTGEIALGILMAWGKCHFAFQPVEEPSASFSSISGPLPEPYRHVENAQVGEAPAYGLPKHVRRVEEALALFPMFKLSRAHRQLFLLINGQRTLIELARLLGKRPEEVEALLHDLEQIRLIQL